MNTFSTAAATLVFVLLFATSAQAQDALGRAKEHYASADYEQALAELAKVGSAESAGVGAEIATFKFFCYVALGLNQEAKQAAETIVRADPLYRPPSEQASPRVLAFFEDVRRPLLPVVIKQFYAEAKGAFDRKEMPVALAGFERVITLIDEDETSPASLESADVRTLAAGFRDLSKMAIAAAAPPPPPAVAAPAPPAPAAPPVAAPAPPRVYAAEDKDIEPPVIRSRPMPRWRTDLASGGRVPSEGVLALEISEDGRVTSARMASAIHPRYDVELVQFAGTWRFTPAMKDGAPVRYLLLMKIVVQP